MRQMLSIDFYPTRKPYCIIKQEEKRNVCCIRPRIPLGESRQKPISDTFCTQTCTSNALKISFCQLSRLTQAEHGSCDTARTVKHITHTYTLVDCAAIWHTKHTHPFTRMKMVTVEHFSTRPKYNTLLDFGEVHLLPNIYYYYYLFRRRVNLAACH